MTRSILTLAAMATLADPVDLTVLTGGVSESKGYDGSDFVVYRNSVGGDQRKLLGGKQLNWTPFANGAGFTPVFQQYLVSSTESNIQWQLEDLIGFDPTVNPPGVVATKEGGGWIYTTDVSQLGMGIQLTLPLTSQSERNFVCALQLIGGIYTVSATVADGSLSTTSLVLNGQNGYNYIPRWFSLKACAYNDTSVTIKVTRTGTDGSNAMGICTQASYLILDVHRPKPRAFTAYMMSRNRGT